MELSNPLLKLDEFAVSLWLHTQNNPPEDEWDRALAENVRFLATHRIHPLQLRSLVVTDGAAPNAAQRAQLSRQVFRDHKCKISVVTTVLSNPVKRGVATALKWINPNFGFFLPEQVPSALDHLELAAWTSRIFGEYAKLAVKLPPNHTLQLVREALAKGSGVHRQAIAAEPLPKKGGGDAA